jgi:hypothetical protein
VFTAGNDLAVCSASYLGSAADDALVGVGATDDGKIFVGATLPGKAIAGAVDLAGGGDGAVARIDPTSGAILSAARIGASVTALAVDPQTGVIAVGGDFGVAALQPDGVSLIWQQPSPAKSAHIALGSDGTVAASAGGGSVAIFDKTGASLGTAQVKLTSLNGVAVDGATQQVFVTGYRQDDGGPCSQYKSTLLHAFSYAGVETWKAYDWTHEQVGASSDCADSTGIGVSVGRDGKLYYTGKSDGGNTVHQKDPRDLAKMAPNVAFDQYNTPYGFKGASALGYYARFAPATGAIEAGQFILARKGNDASAAANAAVPSAVTADATGNVLIVGSSAYQIQDHDAKSVGGQKVGPYKAYELFALVASPDLSQRLVWTVFTGTGPGDAVGVAAAGGLAVLGGMQSAKAAMTGSLITSPGAAQPSSAGGSEGYVVVFPTP